MKTSEMVSHLKRKNIKFEKMSEDDALRYLKYNNNYYNVTAYRHIIIIKIYLFSMILMKIGKLKTYQYGSF